jgi:CRISPR-associated endonuclease/helicase Cas3
MSKTILAKTPYNGVEVDLFVHTSSVLEATGHLFGTADHPTCLGKAWLRLFRINEDEKASFLRHLSLAAIFHDLGKANDGFQRAVRRRSEQVIRHEHLSGLLLHQEPIRSWLTSADGLELSILASAVVSHHVKVSYEEMGRKLIEGNHSIVVDWGAEEVQQCLKLAETFVGSPAPHCGNGALNLSGRDLTRERDGFRRGAHDFERSLKPGDSQHRLLIAVKAGLIAADAVSSGLMREKLTLGEWLNSCFSAAPLTADWIEENILKPRQREIKSQSRKPFVWREFQLAAGKLGQHALLLSACGTGKTLAAWKWIQAQLEVRPVSRVIFLYPTRATATEGFRDYVSWAGPDFGTLQHGTSAYDLIGMFDNPRDLRYGKDFQVQERLFALGYWPKRVFSATVDSFFAFMRNQYASLCMLPVLCDSVVVVDEVHSFDRSMFTALERFLNFFDIPVFCMTATLPQDRERVLREVCKMEVFPSDVQAFSDLREQATFPRYLLSLERRENIKGQVLKALSNREKAKVLWVMNTVPRCQEIALTTALEIQKEIPGLWVRCYHSRFRLKDRKSRHEEVIKAFKEETGPMLLVSTQVCEMSLDLDADVLVTEMAPVSSLIQRMGRCCREAKPQSGRVGKVIIYHPENDRPYDPESLKEGRLFVDDMLKAPQPLSQALLGDYMEKMDVASPFAQEGYVGFLDSKMYAMGRDESFREGDEFTVDAVLDEDVEKYLRAKNSGSPEAAGFVLPVPKRFASENARLGRFLHQAPASHYDPEFGFCEQEVTHV